MKFLYAFTLSLLLLLLNSPTLTAQNWKGPAISGEGSSVTASIDLEEIDGLHLGIPATVEVTQSPTQKITITAQQNIIDNIKKEVRGGSWRIGFHKNAKNFSAITIRISMKTLEELSIGGTGTIVGKGIFKNLEDVSMSIGGTGDIQFGLEAEELTCSIGGSGSMQLRGQADELTISIGGSGDIDAFDLESRECEISSAGSGDINVNCSQELEVSLVGSGDVRYKGNPEVEKSSIGSGTVKKG